MYVSIIIPCFNSGPFLLEALASCGESSSKDFEVIVVNDGSTDFETLSILKDIELKDVFKILTKRNEGPASARNLGVKNSIGEFLLFLDSDNRIRPDFLVKALSIIQKDSTIGVVYGKPSFFGDIAQNYRPFEVGDFSPDRILSGNYIDMCSLVRKETFLEMGGFDEHPDLIGFEDWDLWIRISQSKWKFHFIDEVLFDYRVRKNSLMASVDQEKRFRMFDYLGSKHGYLLHQRYRQYYRLLEKNRSSPFSFFLRTLYYKYILRRPLL